MRLDGTSHYLDPMVHFVRSQAFVLKCYNTLGEEGHWREKARPAIGSFDFFSLRMARFGRVGAPL